MIEKNCVSRPKRLKKMRTDIRKNVFVTTPYQTDQEAIEWKMKKIHPKLFGLWCPIKYELKESEKVLVPYTLFIFNYELKRGGKSRALDRNGEIGVIYDMYEGHCLHFDLNDDLGLEERALDSLKGRILKSKYNRDVALEDAMETVKWRYLRKVFSTIPNVTVKKSVPFYREAWKMNMTARGEEYEKFAYLDVFGMCSENISGLRVRINL